MKGSATTNNSNDYASAARKTKQSTTPLALVVIVTLLVLIFTVLPNDNVEQGITDPAEQAEPSFFIIGTRKGGTASLSTYLSQHPSVCIIEEPNYWNNFDRWSRGYDWYLESFYDNPCPTKQANLIYGEKGNSYLFRLQTPVRILRKLPKAKFIILLRNPIDRLYSHWANEKCRFQLDPSLDFETLVRKNHTFMEYGFYNAQIKNWLKYFDKSQVLILQSEEFFRDPKSTLRQVASFLELPPSDFIDAKENQRIFSRTFGRICTENMRKSFGSVSNDIITYLHNVYKPSIDDLQSLLNKDFGWFPS